MKQLSGELVIEMQLLDQGLVIVARTCPLSRARYSHRITENVCMFLRARSRTREAWRIIRGL